MESPEKGHDAAASTGASGRDAGLSTSPERNETDGGRLNANVIIRREKGRFDLQGWFATRPDERFEIAAITVAELWHGVERATGAHQVKRRHYLQSLLALLPVV